MGLPSSFCPIFIHFKFFHKISISAIRVYSFIHSFAYGISHVPLFLFCRMSSSQTSSFSSFTSSSPPPPSSSPSSNLAPNSANGNLHISDAQWANFWASLLFRYQKTQVVHAANPMPFDSSMSFYSTSSTESPSPGPPAPLNLSIALAELALDFLALLPNLYFLFLLAARRDLHNNLRILLGAFSLALILIAITRIPTQFTYICSGVLYVDAFRWLVFGHEIGVMFFRTIIVPLTIERVLATLRSKTYEQQQSPLIGIFAVLLTLVISTAIGLYIGHELNESSIEDGVISFRGDFYGLYHVIDVSVRLLIWVICFGVFVTLLQYNQRCYAFARLPNKHTLVQRYQFAENVRSSRLLLIVGIILFVCNLHFDFVMLRIAYNKDHFNVEYSQSFDFVLAVALNAIPIAAIWFHPSMFSAFKAHAKLVGRLFLAKCCCIHHQHREEEEGRQSPPSIIFTAFDIQRKHTQKSPRALLTGQKLIVGRDAQQQVYFDELRRSWNVLEEKREKRDRKMRQQSQHQQRKKPRAASVQG